MLAFAGLLVALRVGSCPSSDIYVSATQSVCLHDMLPSPMTQEFLCSAATEDFRCCWTREGVEGQSSAASTCHQTAADSMYADYVQCGETIYDDESGDNTVWSVRCPTDPPAEPAEDLDGATVGTIVVASLIGVALIGGAIAVHLEL